MTEYWPCLLAAVCAIAVLRCAARQRHGMRSLLAGAVCGLGALALLGYNQWDANRADKASQDALGKLYDLIDEEDGRKKPRRGRPPKAKPDKEPPAKGAAK